MAKNAQNSQTSSILKIQKCIVTNLLNAWNKCSKLQTQHNQAEHRSVVPRLQQSLNCFWLICEERSDYLALRTAHSWGSLFKGITQFKEHLLRLSTYHKAGFSQGRGIMWAVKRAVTFLHMHLFIVQNSKCTDVPVLEMFLSKCTAWCAQHLYLANRCCFFWHVKVV